MLKQNFVGYQNFHCYLDRDEFENISCKLEINDAENYETLSSNTYFGPLKFDKLHSTVAEFNFKPIHSQRYDTFETKLQICLMDQNGECLVCLTKNIKIDGEL